MDNADMEDRSMIVRFRDGRTERCVCTLSIDYGQKVATLHRGDSSRSLPFDELKAIFIERGDLEVDRTTEGLDMTVEFSDGEVIRGQALDYNPEKSGFFLFPADTSQHDRIFVVAAAIVSLDVQNL